MHTYILHIYTNILTVHNYINNYSSYMYISINNTFRPKCLKEILELLFKRNSTEKKLKIKLWRIACLKF